MARLARLSVSHQIHYVSQRGHNGSAVFTDELDCGSFMLAMRAAASAFPVDLHGYALTSSGYALLVSPREPQALSSFIQSIGRQYGRVFNQRHNRTGSLWNGRFKSTLVEPNEHFSAIVLWMAEQANATHEDKGWALHLVSSVPYYLGQVNEVCLTPHEGWWATGNTPFERESALTHQLETGLSKSMRSLLLAQLERAWILGSSEFVQGIENLTHRRVVKKRPGRPKKA